MADLIAIGYPDETTADAAAEKARWLVSVGLTVWVERLFPARILLLGVDILRTGLRQSPGAAEAGIGAKA